MSESISGHHESRPVRSGPALAVLAGALGLDISGMGVLNASLPDIGRYFALPEATLQWTMTAYAVTFAGFLLLGGRAADVLGRRRVLTIGVVVFLVAALAATLAPAAWVLIVARAVQGLGAALTGPATLALLAELFPEGPARHRAMGIYAAVGAASFSGGVVLGGLLTDVLGWRSVLAFSVVAAAVLLLGIRPALPRGNPTSGRLDLTGASMVTGGLVLSVFGVSHGSEAGWSDPTVMVSLAVAVTLLIAFVAHERRTAAPLLPMSLFRSTPVRLSSLAAVLNHTGAVGLLFFAPLYMQGDLGYSPFRSGLAVLPSSVVLFVVANGLTGRLLGRYGPRPPMAAGVALTGAAMFVWIFTPPDGHYWLHLLPGLLLSGIGQGLTFPSMTVGALTGIDADRHGVAGAVNVTAQQIGASVGVAALVVVSTVSTGVGTAGRIAGYHAAYLTAAVVCALGAVVIGFARGWSRSNPSMMSDADDAATPVPLSESSPTAR